MAIALGAALWRATRPVERPLLNVSVDLGPDAIAVARGSVALSPDGTRLAYLHGQSDGVLSLAVRELHQPKGTVLAGTAGAEPPFFSPDGQWIPRFTSVACTLTLWSLQGCLG